MINHLGFSSLQIKNDESELQLEIPLEFVSRKLDFDTEYHRMTEDIAGFCEQLLLVWQAPTALRFSADNTRQSKLLLERFLFLRHFLTDEKLGRLLEVIERNPHSQLVAGKVWRPASLAGSNDFLSDPSNMLRDWRRNASGRPVPGQVLDVRKQDTHDTAPNRFVKFALAQFRQICSEVVESMGSKEKNSTVAAEARKLMAKVDAILGKRFFLDISRLQRIPLDNQTLQKGEGYREVLRAWILTQAAASLDWKGQEDSYEGSTRDVATLYEYWIFIKLHQLLEELPGMEIISGDSIADDSIDSFITENTGEILINLKSGKHSRSRFKLSDPQGEDLMIDLHYERTFASGKTPNSSASYSRQFRPDYTLAIFPARFENEKKAGEYGKVAHLHFDAKYRAESVKQMFGEEDSEVSSQNEASLAAEKQAAKAESTYKRGDLLKMHTYNDALRQTIDSYVLYPGSSKDPVKMKKFHEIAPGVGALVMKPGQDECLGALRGFLKDVFAHQASQFTQLRYMTDTRYKTVKGAPTNMEEGGGTYQIARLDAPCVLLWLRKGDVGTFRDNGFAYCRAVPKNDSGQSKKLDLDLSIEVGSEFIPCGKQQGHDLEGFGWRGKVRSARFLSKEKLVEYIAGKGDPGKLKPKSADHYILYEFDEVSDISRLELESVHEKHRSGSNYMAVSCTWQEILDAQPSAPG